MIKKFCLIISLLFLFSCREKINRMVFVNSNNVNEGETSYYTDDLVNTMINNTGKIRVAILVPLSGPVKNVGESLLNAAQLSLFDNKKKNVILRPYDTKGTTFGATQAMNQAVKDGIDVVIGPLFASETKAIQKIAKKNGVVLFSLSNEQVLANMDNVFVTGSIPEQELQLLVSYLNSIDMKNYVSLMPNNEYGANMNKTLRNIIVGKDGLLIKSDYYDSSDESLMSKITDLINYYEIPQTIYEEYQKKKQEQKLLGETEEIPFIIQDDEKIYPQMLFIADGGKNAENIANLLFIIQRNNNAIQLLGTSKLDGDSSVLKNPYMEGTIFVGANPSKYEKFRKKYYETYLVEPVKISSMVYDLIKIIDKIYKQVDGQYLPEKNALLDPYGYDGIDGRFRFLPNGLVERNFYILQIKNKEKHVLYNIDEFLNY